MDDTPPRWPSVLHGLAVWLVIIGVIVLYGVRHSGPPRSEGTPPVGEREMGPRLQGRILLASYRLGGVSAEEAEKQARTTLKEQPLKLAILLGELSGADAALLELKEDKEPLAELLRRLYQEGPPALTEEEKEQLRRGLGWYGDLALAGQEPDGAEHTALLAESRQVLFTGVAFVVGAMLACFGGVFILLLLGSLTFYGHLKLKVGPGRSLVYAETFALYLAGYLALGYLVAWLVPLWSLENWRFGLSGVGMVLSLLALLWPVVRGVTWQELCQDVGLNSQSPLLDLAAGVGTYIAAVPLAAAGLIVVMLIMAGAKRLGVPLSPPSHPVGGLTEEASPWWLWAQVFLIACVLAPLVEEIFFRGVLYTHLRRVITADRPLLGFLLATAVSSFVFAIIHPQGWLGVPVLSALGGAFCIPREVRGSLLPGIVAHGLNNLMATLLMLLVLS